MINRTFATSFVALIERVIIAFTNDSFYDLFYVGRINFCVIKPKNMVVTKVDMKKATTLFRAFPNNIID